MQLENEAKNNHLFYIKKSNKTNYLQMQSFNFEHNPNNKFITSTKYGEIKQSYMGLCSLILKDFFKNEGFNINQSNEGGGNPLSWDNEDTIWIEYEYMKDDLIKTIKITVSEVNYPNYEIKIKWNNEQKMFEKYVEKIRKLIKSNNDKEAFNNALLNYVNS